MGENEQGGMLRTVIVLGLVALIAAVVTVLVIGLKSSAKDHVDDATPPTVSTRLLSVDDFKIKSHDEPGNYSANVSKSVYSWDNASTALHLNTQGLPTKTWVFAESKRFEIPEGSKRMKVSTTAKGSGPFYANTWVHIYEANGRDTGSSNFAAVDATSSKDVFQTRTRIISLKDTASTFTVNLESRENMIVDYKDVSVTFYNN